MPYVTLTMSGASGVENTVSPSVYITETGLSLEIAWVRGPTGPSGAQGVVTGIYPIYYNSGQRSVGIYSGYFALSGDLDASGQYLYDTIVGASGYLASRINDSGQYVLSQINSLSGFVAAYYATEAYVGVASGHLQDQIDLLESWTGTSANIFVLKSESGQFASDSDISDLQSQINLLYPSSNPSGFVTGVDLSDYVQKSETGDFATTGWVLGLGYVTGIETGHNHDSQYYPLSSNPSGYLTGIDLSQYATIPYVDSASGALQGQIDSISLSGLITTGSADARYVNVTGNETIAGTKTFSNATIFSSSTTWNGYDPSYAADGIGKFYQLYADDIYSYGIPGNKFLSMYYRTIHGISHDGQNIAIHVNNRCMQDYSGKKSIDWDTIDNIRDGRKLYDKSESITLDWHRKYLYGGWNVSGGISVDSANINSATINNLFVTGTQTIVNTEILNVASNFLNLNATGGVRDAGIFINTGSNSGAFIGLDVPTNSFRIGFGASGSDLSALDSIATQEWVAAQNYYTSDNPSGFITGVDLSNYVQKSETGIFALAADLVQSGADLEAQISTIEGVTGDFVQKINLTGFTTEIISGSDQYFIEFGFNFSSTPIINFSLEWTGRTFYSANMWGRTVSGYNLDFSDVVAESGIFINTIAYLPIE